MRFTRAILVLSFFIVPTNNDDDNNNDNVNDHDHDYNNIS